MTATVIVIPKTTLIFTSAAINGAAGAAVGTWTSDAGAANTYVTSAGIRSTTATDYVTIPFTGNHLYLCGAGGNLGGRFTVKIDGVDQGGYFEQFMPNGSGANAVRYRDIIPIARNLSSGAHTAILTAVGDGYLTIDQFYAISGAKASPTLNTYAALGDSWTYGVGSSQATGGSYPNGFANQVAKMLSTKLAVGAPFIYTRKGVPGDAWYCRASVPGVGGAGAASGDSTVVGGLYRFLNDIVPLNPQYITAMFGTNDIIGDYSGAMQIVRHVQSFLSLCEDVFDVTGVNGAPVRVALGTGQYATSLALTPLPPSTNGDMRDAFETSAMMIRMVGRKYLWLRLADVAGSLDGRDYAMYPNNQGAADYGVHPNNIGHALVAGEFFHALTS